jgi:outer membrane protein assembly factor BamD
MRLTSAILLIVCLAVSSGCAWFQDDEEKTAEELATEGAEYYAEGRYRKAITSYEKLKDWYPFSEHATMAELKIADAYFEVEEYEDAIFAYEEFEELHPTNEKAPYAIYQIGYCYFIQVDTVDRDQTPAKKALDVFARLIRNFPEHPYSLLAGEHIKECYKSLAGNELYVGLYYYRTGKYKAALHRFKSLVRDYPDVGVHATALQYVPLCEDAIKNKGHGGFWSRAWDWF